MSLFGVGVALLISRYRFSGPTTPRLADRPVGVGLADRRRSGADPGLRAVQRILRQAACTNSGFQIIFSLPGMIMATAFVSMPLVMRSVLPVLDEEGIDQEQAAKVLGASAFQRFLRITLPTIRPALAYGIVLSLARCIGEFGAVKVVSGNISGVGQTETATAAHRRTQRAARGGHLPARLRPHPHHRRSDRVRVVPARKGKYHMSIEVTGIGKKFGDFVALDDVDMQSAAASSPPCSVRAAAASRPCCASSAVWSRRTRARCTSTVVRSPACRRGAATSASCSSTTRRSSTCRSTETSRSVSRSASGPRTRSASACTNCWSSCTSSSSPTGCPRSCPADSGSAWRWPARSLSSRPCCCLDEPFGALDAKVRRELRDWLRRLHDEVHVTTVFVTHDQEEALEVSDEIVVINHGRIEQVGTPADLYDKPANDFVMEFLGPVTTLGRSADPSARRRAVLHPRGRHGAGQGHTDCSGSGSRCAPNSRSATSSHGHS